MSRNAHALSSRLTAGLALLALTLAGMAWLLAGAGTAQASVHKFKVLGDKDSTTKTFRVVGVDADAIVAARLVGPSGKKKVSVETVREGAASDSHKVQLHTQSKVKALKVMTAPDTTITAGPEEGSETTSTTAKFSFTSSTKGSKTKFYCSLDDAPAAACSSGATYNELSAGAHSFSVYSVDRFGAADQTPATRSWSVVSSAPDPGPNPDPEPGPDPDPDPPPPDTTAPDTTAPDTNITSGPAQGSSTTSTSASFSFDGSDDVGVAGYECRLDGSAWSGCSSPKAYSGLSVASHTFSVRAKDAAGNVDASPATRAWSVTASGNVYTVPGSVPSGCSTDATAQILSWIASVPNNSTVQFDTGACYRIEGTLELRNRNLTIDGNGSTFKSLDAPTGQRSMWRAFDSTVTFRNMTIVGSYTNGGVHDGSLQWAHGIDLRGTDVVVENVSMSDLGGDCVYFGLGADRSSGAVRDSSCRRIGRNGVSVVAGDDIRVERMTTDRIGYIAFDVEPNTGAGNGSSRVVFDSNTIGSYYMKAYTVIGNAPVSDQKFTNNTVVGQGLKIGVIDRSHRPQRLTITGNSSDTPTAPAAMNLDGIDGATVSSNTVPMTSGTMAQVGSSCNVNVSGNSYPGGSNEASITNSTC
jgi:hypothetical protein